MVTTSTATNNIIAGNCSTITSAQYPAVRVHGGTANFLHNTIACNEGALGIQVDSGATVGLTNTILVSHTVGINFSAGTAATLGGTLWGSGLWAK